MDSQVASGWVGNGTHPAGAELSVLADKAVVLSRNARSQMERALADRHDRSTSGLVDVIEALVVSLEGLGRELRSAAV